MVVAAAARALRRRAARSDQVREGVTPVRMVVTGRQGQIVRSLLERASTGLDIVSLGRPELDLAGPADAIVSAIEQAQPDILVSAAAYTQVDKAESEPDLAFAVNERGPRALARAARGLGIPLVHLSTDYVFDGSKPEPYIEEDETRPTGVYGASKLAGEQAVLEEHSNSAVLRTAWVYSPFGTNFLETMIGSRGIVRKSAWWPINWAIRPARPISLMGSFGSPRTWPPGMIRSNAAFFTWQRLERPAGPSLPRRYSALQPRRAARLRRSGRLRPRIIRPRPVVRQIRAWIQGNSDEFME